MTAFVDALLCRNPVAPYLNVVPVSGDTIRIDVPVTFGGAVLAVLNDLSVGSQIFVGLTTPLGYAPAESPDGADMVILNTSIFI